MLDAQVTEASLADPSADMPYGHWLRPLWKLAQALSAQREKLLSGRQPGRPGHARAPGAPPAQRAAGPDGGRIHDPGEQPVGRLAAPARRAGHLPFATGGPGAHEHAGAAARGYRRAAIRLEHVTAAPLCRPGQPMAADRCGGARRISPPGGTVQAARRGPLRDHRRAGSGLRR
ncbi:hypothetical protein G6F31_017882 [Rhizopus arrhizus]|nr:hypothetical protein G6F31_017882 [Rhizopus arrhizus]